MDEAVVPHPSFKAYSRAVTNLSVTDGITIGAFELKELACFCI